MGDLNRRGDLNHPSKLIIIGVYITRDSSRD